MWLALGNTSPQLFKIPISEPPRAVISRIARIDHQSHELIKHLQHSFVIEYANSIIVVVGNAGNAFMTGQTIGILTEIAWHKTLSGELKEKIGE
jgi:hypothetical protein